MSINLPELVCDGSVRLNLSISKPETVMATDKSDNSGNNANDTDHNDQEPVYQKVLVDSDKDNQTYPYLKTVGLK